MTRRVTLLLMVAFCFWATMAQATNHQVLIIDFSFSPSNITINFGDSVTWTNNGGAIHTTTSNTGVWNSGDLAPLQSFSFVFDTSGTFAYHCIHHPSMTGNVTVNPAPFNLQINIGDNFYSPQVIQINPGQSIGWVNRGMHQHTATADDGTFDSGTLLPGQFFMFSFPAEGVHPYHCLIHGLVMNGTVVVGKPDSVAFDIHIVDFAFAPADTTVTMGQNVRWINFGTMEHTTTDTSANHWNSGTLNPGNTFTLHADSAGVYNYLCIFHPTLMSGQLTVLDTTGSGCVYLLGDINGNGQADGVDVVFLVRYLKGGSIPPIACDCGSHGIMYPAGDVNGDCEVNAVDVTYFVRYLKGGNPLIVCPDCPSGI